MDGKFYLNFFNLSKLILIFLINNIIKKIKLKNEIKSQITLIDMEIKEDK